MDEELINLDENIEIYTEDIEQDIESEEIVEVVEVEAVEEVEIDVDETVGWVGGDSTRHYSLYGREEPDQHPITSITGLREELNDIEALDVVYSNERNQADYYLWKDENKLQENRVGYFVKICPDINKIEKCTSDNDIFGVTVDSAGFIGAQDDITRDIKYGLVVTTGVVHVRCEQSVNVGDYVVSNDYGYAQSNKNGYKVVGRHQIDGIEYAEITLATPINQIRKLSDDVEIMGDRMNNAENNIVAAINAANAAYNKSEEADNVSVEALKDALKALNQSNETSKRADSIESNVSFINEMAVQAKTIAESALTSIETIRKEAVDTSNQALADVNDLIKDLDPITTWSDPDSGNVGVEYLTTYIKDGLATKAEIQTVENLTEEHKSFIEKNAESIQTMVSSVDKYSVGEFSQAYGLTQIQANSILKPGMIYIPIGGTHKENNKIRKKMAVSWCQINSGDGVYIPINKIYVKDDYLSGWNYQFEDGSSIFSADDVDTISIELGEPYYYIDNINEFTEGNHYEWDGDDWCEYLGTVITSYYGLGTGRLYWYINSDDAPEGYEPHALYVFKDNEYIKVNMLSGNSNNRITSMIKQTADEIAAEVVSARGNYAGLNLRLEEDNKAHASMIASVANEDGEVTAASIVNAVNEGDSSIRLKAKHILFDGEVTATDDFSLTGGNIYLSDGGKIIGGEGMFSNLQFTSSGDVGFHVNYESESVIKKYVELNVFIPSGFTVKQAILTLRHRPHRISGQFFNGSTNPPSFSNLACCAKNMQLYKATKEDVLVYDLNSEFLFDTSVMKTLTNTFDGGWSPNNTNESVETSVSLDIANLDPGYNRFFIETKDSSPSYPTTLDNYKNILKQTGTITAYLDIFGYMRVGK